MNENVSVTLEVLHNTRSVQIFVFPAIAAPKLRLDREKQLAVVEIGSKSFTFVLPKNVQYGTSVQMLKSEDHVLLRLALEPFGPCDSVLLQSKMREAPESVMPNLQQANNRLMCRLCEKVAFVEGSPFSKVLRLPSVCWQELAELWGCHTETFAAAPNRPIEIERGTLYVGDSLVVLDSSHGKNLNRSPNGMLQCSACSGLVGRASKQTISLYFDCLTDGRGLWSQFTSTKRLARSLVDRATSSGELRFLAGLLLLVVVNMDTTLAVCERTPSEPIVKIRFSLMQVQPVLEDDLGVISLLDWSEEEVKQVCVELAKNQKHLPPTFALMNLSFLWL